MFQRGGRKQHKHVFVLSLSLLLNHLEPQSSKAKLVLPIMPIAIVAYAFTLSWDNLCRNSCRVVEPRSTRDIEILFKLIVKVPVVGNTADTPNPPGLLPF